MYAGGAVAARRARIVRAFARCGAFNEASARSLEELGLYFGGRLIFRRMLQRGIIIETNDGRYYMDQGYYEARMRRLSIVRPVAIGVVALLLIFTLFMAIFYR